VTGSILFSRFDWYWGQSFSMLLYLLIALKMLIELLARKPRQVFDLFPLSNVNGSGIFCKHGESQK
jgi:hypothetical protein